MSQVNFLALVLIFSLGLTNCIALGQFTDEFIACLDGSSPDTCRETAVEPNKDGVVIWDRAVLGSFGCVGAGITPQEEDCTFTIALYIGHDCMGEGLFPMDITTRAGLDLTMACGEFDSPPGDYSLRFTRSSCFDGQSSCLNSTFLN